MKIVSLLFLSAAILFPGFVAAEEEDPKQTILRLKQAVDVGSARYEKITCEKKELMGQVDALGKRVEELQQEGSGRSAELAEYKKLLIHAETMLAETNAALGEMARDRKMWEGRAWQGKAETDKLARDFEAFKNQKQPVVAIPLPDQRTVPAGLQLQVPPANQPTDGAFQSPDGFPQNPKPGQEHYQPNGTMFVFFDQKRQGDPAQNYLGWHEIMEGHQKRDGPYLRVCHREQGSDGKFVYSWPTKEEYRAKFDVRRGVIQGPRQPVVSSELQQPAVEKPEDADEESHFRPVTPIVVK